MKMIPLTQGKFAKVDDEDYEELSKFKWQLNNGYARRTERIDNRNRQIYMHRVIARVYKDQNVDHISGDRLDNRRSNIRIATTQQNACNRGANSNNTSGYKGVCWHKKGRKWVAQVWLNRENIYLGLFEDRNEAIAARISAAQKYHGEFFHA